jgi:hypothetical protein
MTQNRYNEETRLVLPTAPAQPYAITPGQAAQLERIAQAPEVIQRVGPVHTSHTSVEVTEQFSPVEQAAGIFRLAGIGLGVSAFVTLGLGVANKLPSFEAGAVGFTALTLIVTLGLYWRQTAFSQIGLAYRRIRYQRDVAMRLIESNEVLSLEKIQNENSQHEREIGLRREAMKTYTAMLTKDA